ncbi:beta-catenin binding [Homalodisca vitripennis]|nr:beta-catenin binding [Homalodisca vitripennis]
MGFVWSWSWFQHGHIGLSDSHYRRQAHINHTIVVLYSDRDRLPYFEEGIFELDIEENEEINHLILTVTAKDRKDKQFAGWLWVEAPEITARLHTSTQLCAGTGQVVAADADNERPKEIVYSLTGQGVDADNPINNKYEIGRTTGEIFVLKPLNRDKALGRPQWRFTVFAQDDGGEGLVGYADVQVNMKDINYNAPNYR